MTEPSGRIHQPFDDDDDELMALFRAMPDEEVDALLSGRPTASAAPPADGGLSEVMAVLRADAGTRGAPPMSDDLRRQLHRPVRLAPSRRRRLVAGGVVGIVLGTSAAGAAAAQNVLPAVVQDAASNAADLVGVDIPRATERDERAPGSTDERDGTGEGGGTPSTGPSDGPSTSSSDDPNGPPTSTPGGATPADPSGDGPATPGSGPEDPGSQGQGNQEQGLDQVPEDPGEQGQGNQGQGKPAG